MPGKKGMPGKGAGVSLAKIKQAAKAKEEEKKKEQEIKAKKEANEALRKEMEKKRIEEEEESKKKALINENKKLNIKDKLRRFVLTSKEHEGDKVETKKEESKLIIEYNKEYKSPICCILGHVDTGKTKLLDKLRESNIQGAEAGGITQQIGATFFPIQVLADNYKTTNSDFPGILIIDTPGHESFTSLRSRGHSLCNIAILVVDIMHGLEPQTLESIGLLKKRRTPFIVALNKIDRIYNWENGVKYENQNTMAKDEFDKLVLEAKQQIAEQGINSTLFTENADPKKFVSIVPTSAISGDGLDDLIKLILSLSSTYMKEKMKIVEKSECSVLEVKHLEGFGVTLDCILSNGSLKEGDKIGLSGFDGPIISTIRNILVPEPLKEMRVKSEYKAVQRVSGSAGVKIFAHDLDSAIPGSNLYVVNDDNKEEVLNLLSESMSSFNSGTSTEGVTLVSNTLGSMEALVSFFDSAKIPIGSKVLGKIKKKDILRAATAKNKFYNIILSFNVIYGKDIEEIAKDNDVTIYTAEIIYHLFDYYKNFTAKLISKDKEIYKNDVVFPVKLKILPNCVFCSRTPLVLGVLVEKGSLRVNTPICVFKGDKIVKLGKVVSIEENKKAKQSVEKESKVAIKIDNSSGNVIFDRHFTVNDPIYSVVTRSSLNIIKNYFSDELTQDDLELLFFLKSKFMIA